MLSLYKPDNPCFKRCLLIQALLFQEKSIVELQISTNNQTITCSSDSLAIQTSSLHLKVLVFPILMDLSSFSFCGQLSR